MATYGVFDARGKATAFYDDSLHEVIPPEAQLMSDEHYIQMINDQSLLYKNRIPTPPTPADLPPPAIPDIIEMWQAQAVLRGMPNLPNGTPMYSAIDSYIQGLGDATLLSAWERGNFVHRNGQLFKAVADHFGMSASQLDALFVQAAAIQP